MSATEQTDAQSSTGYEIAGASPMKRLSAIGRSHGGWIAFGLSVLCYVALSETLHMPYVFWNHPDYFDLNVYRSGILAMVNHGGLYAGPVYHGDWFTYPPFAALVLWPISLVSVKIDEPIVTALNIFGVLWLMRRTLMLPGLDGTIDSVTVGSGAVEGGAARPVKAGSGWQRAAWLATFALWLEPISLAIGYGQVDVLIALLVVLDLTRPAGARGSGVLIGLAAAIKLTPLLFIAYLLACGRLRAARNAAATFVASIAAAYILVPSAARAYWGGGLYFNSHHVGPSMQAIQESIRGLLIKLGTSPTGLSWLVVAVPVGVLGMYLAVRAGRRGDTATGYAFTALSCLLCSPISWSHHWVLAVPALVVLGLRGWRRRSRPLIVATIVLAAIAFAYIPELSGRHRTWSGINLLWADPYVLVGLVVLATATAVAVTESRR